MKIDVFIVYTPQPVFSFTSLCSTYKPNGIEVESTLASAPGFLAREALKRAIFRTLVGVPLRVAVVATLHGEEANAENVTVALLASPTKATKI